MGKNDMTFSLHLTLDGKEHLVTAAAAAKEVQRAVDQSRTAYSSYTNICYLPVIPHVKECVCFYCHLTLFMRNKLIHRCFKSVR
ncbi:hypothetical protein [Prevotellamassilia timonensis]|uniref:hypothetical protein n=2 Tax=Prevotellamassilia timonensis TaxID=1852370 RepID=UPI0008D9545F